MTTSESELDVAYGGVPAGKEHIYSQKPVLSGRKLVITFGRVVGLDGVDVDLYPGEILAVIGDNGAGKSTLIKCLTGRVRAGLGHDHAERRTGELQEAAGRP